MKKKYMYIIKKQKMSYGKALAIKRINKDMKEISKSPIEGIGIASIDNNPMKYVINLLFSFQWVDR